VRDAAHRTGAEAAAVDGAFWRVPRLVWDRLRRILAGRVGEDHAVCDNRLFGEIHVARQPGRRKLPASITRLQLERGYASTLRPRVLDRRLEVLADRTPERREHPLRAVFGLPRAERAPDAFLVEGLCVVADERRGVQRRSVILSAERVAVEQP